VAKLVRLEACLNANPSINASRPYPFLLLDGLIADLTPWMQCGGHGTVSGIPNFAPAASMRLWALLNKKDSTNEERDEAGRIQAVLSNADVAAVPAGVRGMSRCICSDFVALADACLEFILNRMHGYGTAPRRPLLPLGEKEGDNLLRQFREMLDLEEMYSKV
jgi:4-hydroxy-2-oxoglutarate aldolase